MNAWRSLQRFSRFDVIMIFTYSVQSILSNVFSLCITTTFFLCDFLNCFSFFYEFKHPNRLLYEERFHQASTGAVSIESFL